MDDGRTSRPSVTDIFPFDSARDLSVFSRFVRGTPNAAVAAKSANFHNARASDRIALTVERTELTETFFSSPAPPPRRVMNSLMYF